MKQFNRYAPEEENISFELMTNKGAFILSEEQFKAISRHIGLRELPNITEAAPFVYA